MLAKTIKSLLFIASRVNYMTPDSVRATVIRDNLQDIIPFNKKVVIVIVSNLNPSGTQKLLEKVMIVIKRTPSLGGAQL